MSAVAAFALAIGVIRTEAQGPALSSRPNIVFIMLDDASAALGSYGDPQAITPNMDQLAQEGVRFTGAYAHTPVCAPMRSGMVTGMYPTTLGSHPMRSRLANPPETYMSLLRKAGYYVAFPGKLDFNFASSALPPGSFDSTEPMLNDRTQLPGWVSEAPPRQPFFAYANLNITHESQTRASAELHARNTRRLQANQRHDPAQMRVPAYLPDAPEVRKDLAQFYDTMTAADYMVGDVLAWIDRHNLRENTMVIFTSDHGTGMPRSKRWPYRSGVHVPFIVRWPGQVPAGTVRDDLISLIDFAPTVLDVAGAEIPERMQGQVFMGPHRAPDRQYVYAHRDRMDETYDHIRTVIDGRFQYIRNFRPDLPYAQVINYNEQNPTMQVWRRLYSEGRLFGPPALFFAPTKPVEELYDLTVDPDTVGNLADDPTYESVLRRMRTELDRWMAETRDLGHLSEEELVERGILAPAAQRGAGAGGRGGRGGRGGPASAGGPPGRGGQ